MLRRGDRDGDGGRAVAALGRRRRRGVGDGRPAGRGGRRRPRRPYRGRGGVPAPGAGRADAGRPPGRGPHRTGLAGVRLRTFLGGHPPARPRRCGCRACRSDRVRAAVALGTALARRGEARAAVRRAPQPGGRPTDEPPGPATHGPDRLGAAGDHDQEDPGKEMYRWLRETAEHSPGHSARPARPCSYGTRRRPGLTSAEAAMKRSAPCWRNRPTRSRSRSCWARRPRSPSGPTNSTKPNASTDRGLAGQRPTLLHPMHLALLNVRADIAAARGRRTPNCSSGSRGRGRPQAGGSSFRFGLEWATGTGEDQWSEAANETGRSGR
jgi:hypothetical protein